MIRPGAATDTLDPQYFARLRDHFHRLIDADAAAREAMLDGLEREHPRLGGELRALLLSFDETDLVVSPDRRIPHQLGPFRLRHRIGRGGMGDVFLAQRDDGAFEQTVAVKLIRDTALSAETLRRFQRERGILARLQHPNIARLVDGGVDAAGRPWLAMEYVEGANLLTHAAAARLDLDARVSMMRKVCAAVAYAHRTLVVHRDLKPSNVLVTAQGEPKLLDFGIAKMLDDSDAELTRTAQRALTLRYAAPEQIAGDHTTTATDIHALGVLLHELIVGRSPFVRAERGEVGWHQAILSDPPQPLAEAVRPLRAHFARREWSRLSGDLGRILQRAMAKSAASRYPGVASLDADLEDWLARRPLRSGIGSATAQTRFLLRRFRWPLALTGAVLLALALGAWVALQQAKRAQEQADIAGVHLEALLDVIGSANPRKFAGRDPTASEFLMSASQRLQASYASDPALSRRALIEIGHGLLNLGRTSQAGDVLQQALEATRRDPEADAGDALAVLALLAQTQDDAGAVDRLAHTAAEIERLARVPGVAPADAADALARSGGALARSGDFAAAERALDAAQALIEVHPQIDVGIVENFWRQRGWSALRALDLAPAAAALARSAKVAAMQPERFSALRRAEGELLRAEVALWLGESRAADAALAAARATFFAEYDAGHPERAAFELQQARAERLRGDTDAALRTIEHAVPVLEAHAQDYVRVLPQAQALRAGLLAETGHCGLAGEAAARAQASTAGVSAPLQPRERASLQQMHVALDAYCAGQGR